MDIDIQIDDGKMDIIFTCKGVYSNHTVTMEEATNLARDIIALVSETIGDKSPRLYDAENMLIEKTIYAVNTMNRLQDRCGKAVDELTRFLKEGQR